MIKEYFLAKSIAAAVIAVLWGALVCGSIASLTGDSISSFLPSRENEAVFDKAYMTRINGTLTENVLGRSGFLNLYGLLQRFLDKNEENNFEIVKDEQGFGHYMYFGEKGRLDSELVERVAALQAAAATQNTKVVSVIPLDRSIAGYTTFAKGIPNGYFNERGDLYAAALQEKGIPFLDLREAAKESALDPTGLFFRTDHNWRVETAFWAYVELVHYLEKTQGFQADAFYLNKANYNFIRYSDYLGAMGRKTGKFYLGLDSFTLVYPKFSTNFFLEIDEGTNKTTSYEGRFEKSLLSQYPFATEADLFDPSKDKYSAYLHGYYPVGHIVNKNNPTGPKALFIKDSFAHPVIAFFANLCSEVWIIDPQQYKGSLESVMAGKRIDYVFLLFSLPDTVKEAVPLYR